MSQRPTFAAPSVRTERRPDGTLILASGYALEPYERCLGDLLVRWATATPDRDFLLERAGTELRRVTYREALAQVRSLAQSLLARELGPSRPLVVLSESSVDHALLALAAMHVGIPVVPVSPAYSLLSTDFSKLRHILGLVAPGAVFAADGARFEKALGLAEQLGADVLVSGRTPRGIRATELSSLLTVTPTAEVDTRFEALTPDTISKLLFTSGSTGLPKGVVNTQRMMCANQTMIAMLWPSLRERPPIVVDWLPWSHTFGGNHNFNLVLANGGTLLVDEGRPAPGMIEKTVANLRDLPPTHFFNVPRGFDALLPFLENDEGFRSLFFRDLELVFYAAAALPEPLWNRMADVSIKARGDRVTMVSAWGSTETAPLVTSVHFPIESPGNLGLPAPGMTVKLAPYEDKYELRVKGPTVTPGYYAREEETAAALDEEGFFRMGDAGKLLDDEHPELGIAFDGRLAENFKLSTGTWVNAGELRLSLIAAAAPVVSDAVITGHDRDRVGALLFANVAALAALSGLPANAPASALINDPAVQSRVREGLAKRNRQTSGTTRIISRCLFLLEPPSLDDNEITDKGYLNQRAVLARRAAEVEELHAIEPSSRVLVIPS